MPKTPSSALWHHKFLPGVCSRQLALQQNMWVCKMHPTLSQAEQEHQSFIWILPVFPEVQSYQLRSSTMGQGMTSVLLSYQRFILFLLTHTDRLYYKANVFVTLILVALLSGMLEENLLKSEMRLLLTPEVHFPQDCMTAWEVYLLVLSTPCTFKQLPFFSSLDKFPSRSHHHYE